MDDDFVDIVKDDGTPRNEQTSLSDGVREVLSRYNAWRAENNFVLPGSPTTTHQVSPNVVPLYSAICRLMGVKRTPPRSGILYIYENSCSESNRTDLAQRIAGFIEFLRTFNKDQDYDEFRNLIPVHIVYVFSTAGLELRMTYKQTDNEKYYQTLMVL